MIRAAGPCSPVCSPFASNISENGIDVRITIVSEKFPDETNSSINFNHFMELNAVDYSFDHDVEPSADQELNFTWACRELNEVSC